MNYGVPQAVHDRFCEAFPDHEGFVYFAPGSFSDRFGALVAMGALHEAVKAGRIPPHDLVVRIDNCLFIAYKGDPESTFKREAIWDFDISRVIPWLVKYIEARSDRNLPSARRLVVAV